MTINVVHAWTEIIQLSYILSREKKVYYKRLLLTGMHLKTYGNKEGMKAQEITVLWKVGGKERQVYP